MRRTNAGKLQRSSPTGYDARNFSEEELEDNVIYAEYGNTGTGADASQRVPWAKQYTAEQAKPYLTSASFFTNLGLGTDWIDSNFL